MNDDGPNDSVLTRELRDSLSVLGAPPRPPLAAVTGRGRARQRRRLAGFAGVGVAGAAASTALALSVTGVLGATPARSTGATEPGAPAGSTGTIRTAAFTLTNNANGTDTLAFKLTMSEILNLATLQQALARDGIPAIVKTGSYCSSSPPAPDPRAIGVLSVRSPGKKAGLVPSPGVPKASQLNVMRTVTVINPAAMPRGTKLFFGYFNSYHLVWVGLVYARSYSCSSQPPRAES